MVNYNHLTVRLPKKWWFRYKFMKASARLVDRFPIVGKASRFIGYRFVNFANSGKSFKVHQEYVDLLNKNEEDANRSGSPYGYEEYWEISTVINYHKQLGQKNFENIKSESPALYKEAIKILRDIFQKDPEAKAMLDFGVAYGHMNSVLAKDFQDRKFIGVDRSPFVKLYNDICFSNLQNLSFHAGDIFDLLSSNSELKNGLLFHARTMVCMPPRFAKKLYKAAFDASVRYIVGFEQVGVSRQTDRFYEFSDVPKESVFFRDFMYIHNYPGILKECGYAIQDIGLVRTNNPHEDLRLLRFVAKRI